MRAAKLLSRNGGGAITRLCDEREVLTPHEKSRNGRNDQGDTPSKDGRPHHHHHHHHHQRRDTRAGTSVDHQPVNGGQGGRRSHDGGRFTTFPAGEERSKERDDSGQPRARDQVPFEGSNTRTTTSSGTGHNEQRNRPRTGRRSFTHQSGNANEARFVF